MMRSTPLPGVAPARVLACGAYLKNTACLIEDRRVLWSEPHGDLGEAASRAALEASVERLLTEAAGPPQAVAHDLHPDFHSTRVALALADRLGVPAIGVQHHHAHIAVVQAEQAVEGPVIGLALDGMGLGDDGGAWGGEVLWVAGSTAAHQWRRLDHLAPIALPGGDVAAREPWRMAAAALQGLGRADEIEARFSPVVGGLAARVVRDLLQRSFHCPATTSAGRWFDAAAGALGLCARQRFEAEAALALERHASDWLVAHPGFDVDGSSLDLAPVLAELFTLADRGHEARGRGAALFHAALASGLAHNAIRAARAHGTRTVVLGGGCFVNRVLTGRLIARLEGAGLAVLQPRRVGCGDAGLALGQAWIASCAVNAAGARPVEHHERAA
jgi:hydrogenase maturation protein HypF